MVVNVCTVDWKEVSTVGGLKTRGWFLDFLEPQEDIHHKGTKVTKKNGRKSYDYLLIPSHLVAPIISSRSLPLAGRVRGGKHVVMYRDNDQREFARALRNKVISGECGNLEI
jgi:hypothetical protein